MSRQKRCWGNCNDNIILFFVFLIRGRYICRQIKQPMKKIILILLPLLLCACITADAQKRSSREARNMGSCPRFYIGLSTGLENQSGLIGFNMDVPIKSFSLGAGFGLASWGYKSYLEARYYFNPCNRGWALGTGVTYNTGLTNFTTLLPTTTGDQDVTLNLHPKTNVFLAGYRFWNLGKRGNRFYLELGYSLRLDENNYTVVSNHKLTSDGDAVMTLLAPGGLIFGLGFSFGLGK